MATEIKSQANVPVVPIWIVNEERAQQYLSGRAWYAYSTNVRITEQYLLDKLKWMSEKSPFSGKYDDYAIKHLGFLFGMLSQEH